MLPYSDMPAFMTGLRTREGIAARALEFVILTAVRINEATTATWDEIDLGRAVWVVPPERMKAAKEHRVPLSPPSVELLEAMKARRQDGNYVFPRVEDFAAHYRRGLPQCAAWDGLSRSNDSRLPVNVS